MGKLLGQDFEGNPKLAAEFPWAALTAAEYWKSRNINKAADKNDIKAVTRIINGGYNGLSDRVRYFDLAKAALNSKTQPPQSIDIAAAQKRLSELSYPLGSFDGKIGPLTRSAVRDFQDAAGFPVTGNLDAHTYAKLMSPDAPPRPVSEERKALTVSDLKNSGSKIITSTDSIKNNVTTAAGALAAASGVATQVQDAATQAQSISDAVKTGQGWLSMLHQDWKLIAIGFLLIVVSLCIYKIWKEAATVEETRLDAARRGENVRV
jgi:peptidoglycan hydrolase-like protein with peptidoglycan-binding domain